MSDETADASKDDDRPEWFRRLMDCRVPGLPASPSPFGPGRDPAGAVHLAPRFRSRLGCALAFREAARILATEPPTGPHRWPLVCEPCMYLYRQAAELAVKEVLYQAGRLECFHGGSEPTYTVARHRLAPLWEEALRILQQRGVLPGPEDAADAASVAETLKVLDAADPKGEGFRYSLTTGKPPRPTLATDVVLAPEPLERVMGSLVEYLVGLADQLLGGLGDMMAEAR
jgi:hypothetical protein